MLAEYLIVMSLLFFQACTCMPDATNSNTGDEQNESAQGSILRRYFGLIGIEVNSYDEAWIKRYDKSILDLMKVVLDDNYDHLDLGGKSRQINNAIFKLEVNKAKKLDPINLATEEQAALSALDLILPDTELTKPAKDDLKKFVEEETDLAHDLLDRLVYAMDQGPEAANCEEIAHLLATFYYRWIPLGRLGRFMDTSAV